MSFLLRLERDALIACAAMAAAVLLAPFGGPWSALGVLGGGALAAVSYRGLKAVVFGAVGAGSGRAGALVKFFTRHAMLAVAAYVMLARLRLPAWAVAAGASSLVVAVVIAAARAFGSVPGPGNPR
ncbi:MAG: hypothetical protein JJE40_10215 [Vicinamibacteria bacterium]|nr:hypothetical protein [Vicinamibacteria bacterium]